MVVEGAEVTLGVGVQTLVKQLGDNGTLYLQGTCRNVHHMVKTLVEVSLIGCKISNSREVDGDNTDRTGGLTATEETTRLLAKLTKVKT